MSLIILKKFSTDLIALILYLSRMAEGMERKSEPSGVYSSISRGSRMSDSLSASSDFYYDPFCEICFQTKWRNLKADGYCNDCIQFLCENCLRVHKEQQGARDHVIS